MVLAGLRTLESELLTEPQKKDLDEPGNIRIIALHFAGRWMSSPSHMMRGKFKNRIGLAKDREASSRSIRSLEHRRRDHINRTTITVSANPGDRLGVTTVFGTGAVGTVGTRSDYTPRNRTHTTTLDTQTPASTRAPHSPLSFPLSRVSTCPHARLHLPLPPSSPTTTTPFPLLHSTRAVLSHQGTRLGLAPPITNEARGKRLRPYVRPPASLFLDREEDNSESRDKKTKTEKTSDIPSPPRRHLRRTKPPRGFIRQRSALIPAHRLVGAIPRPSIPSHGRQTIDIDTMYRPSSLRIQPPVVQCTRPRVPQLVHRASRIACARFASYEEAPHRK
ncbi:hypothetical protein B0H13DRAFT_2277838 [Mycena leptocephala]|nr:hypothetical protein B0H13DRAFT_2277838 [Mycena leptocephala]